jgi:hypothetical protein
MFRPTAISLMKTITDLTKKYEDVFDSICGKSKLDMLKEIEDGKTETELSSSPAQTPLISVQVRSMKALICCFLLCKC